MRLVLVLLALIVCGCGQAELKQEEPIEQQQVTGAPPPTASTILDPRLIGYWVQDLQFCNDDHENAYAMVRFWQEPNTNVIMLSEYEKSCTIGADNIVIGGVSGTLQCGGEGEVYSEVVNITLTDSNTLEYVAFNPEYDLRDETPRTFMRCNLPPRPSNQ